MDRKRGMMTMICHLNIHNVKKKIFVLLLSSELSSLVLNLFNGNLFVESNLRLVSLNSNNIIQKSTSKIKIIPKIRKNDNIVIGNKRNNLNVAQIVAFSGNHTSFRSNDWNDVASQATEMFLTKLCNNLQGIAFNCAEYHVLENGVGIFECVNSIDPNEILTITEFYINIEP